MRRGARQEKKGAGKGGKKDGEEDATEGGGEHTTAPHRTALVGGVYRLPTILSHRG